MSEKEIVLFGVSAFFGIGIGRAYFLDQTEFNSQEVSEKVKNQEEEISRYQQAITDSVKDIQGLQLQLKNENALEGVQVLESHLHFLKDPMMTTEIEEEIRRTKCNGNSVLLKALKGFKKEFLAISDPFFQERFKDVEDVIQRIMCHLKNKVSQNFSTCPKGSVIFIEDLSPSQMAAIKPGSVAGIVTKEGGATSHAAIIAKSKGIPFISSVDFSSYRHLGSNWVILDGRKGQVILDPTEKTKEDFIEFQNRHTEMVEKVYSQETLAISTFDDHPISFFLNVNDPNEIHPSYEACQGVGLFRTEFLLDRGLNVPHEDEQLEIYKRLLMQFKDKPVVIRVFDFGGDKGALAHDYAHEQNPALGLRAIRFMLKEGELFNAQIRALMRASTFGDLRILFPMISSIDELRRCKQRMAYLKEQLENEGHEIKLSIPVGCMVEVPSAALIADHLAKESDFLSFGTNDLVQYTLAVDRSNSLVSDIYSPHHPGFIRLMSQVIKKTSCFDISINICGEIASDPHYTPLLIGLGLKSFSISQNTLLQVKEVVERVTVAQCSALAKEVMEYASADEVRKALFEFYESVMDCAVCS